MRNDYNFFDDIFADETIAEYKDANIIATKPETPKTKVCMTAKRAAAEFKKGKQIIAEDCEYSMDDYSTLVGNNVLAVGSVGCGKTRHIVTPNIHEAKGSYLITDPKGNLYKKYGDYLKSKGYDVKLVDFINPKNSVCYNPFAFIGNVQDILKIAYAIIYSDKTENTRDDPFWNNAATVMLSALIGYLYEKDKKEGTSTCTIAEVMRLLRLGVRENEDTTESELTKTFCLHKHLNPDSWACEQFDSINIGANRTFECIRVTISGKFSTLDTVELREMTSKNELGFRDIANRKTAVFVNVSDTDRSMDMLVNLFFAQAMNELCSYADKECEDGRLPIPVRFILDDFATNCRIKEFPRMISSFRSRAISVMLMIQAEAQLKAYYGEDYATIIASCDTYVYLGGNDPAMHKTISERCDRPYREVANMPVGSCWVFRRGSKPVFTKLKNPEKCIKEMTAVKKLERGA